jgi:CBS domain-containing protein
MDAIFFIQQQHPFDKLTAAEIEKVKATLQTTEYPAGAYILHQGGEPSKSLQLIRCGTVRLMRDGQMVQALEEGDCFGYPSLIGQTSPTSDVVAENTAVIYQIPENVFHSLTDNHHFAEFFLKNLGERLRQLTNTIVTTPGGDLTTAVGSLIVRPAVTVHPDASVAETARKMREAWVDVALVTDNPPGIITDHDFQVKVLAESLGPATKVSQVMTRPLKMLPADTPVHGALLFMLEENIHHLPVTVEGQITGIVTATDLLRHQTRSPLYLMRQLEDLNSSKALSNYSIEIAGMVKNLFEGGLDVVQIGRVIANINDTLLRRLLRQAEQVLGPPPTPYAWIVFGSEGRMEQALITDQDNAIIYQTDTPEAEEYVNQLADRVIAGLTQAGFPACPGGYMATQWSKPIAEWVELFRSWVKTPYPENLLQTAIFFDFRRVYGSLPLDTLESEIKGAAGNGVFLAQLARAAIEFKPPLGFFRQIIADDGEVDLKKGGIAPIVSLARVYGLEGGGIEARSTLARLDAAFAAGTMSQHGNETLKETYRFLLQLRLREQLATLTRNLTPDNKVRLKSLTATEKKHLKDAFLAIREMQAAASQRFRTDMLG